MRRGAQRADRPLHLSNCPEVPLGLPTSCRAPQAFQQSVVGESLLCKLQAEVPSLSTPNWIAMLTGLRPEVHGKLGNRGPEELEYSSLASVTLAVNAPAVLISTPWFVDLVRSQLPPLGGDGAVSAAYEDFEALSDETTEYDTLREQALLLALNGTSRLVMAQLSEINHAGHRHGVEYGAGEHYANAIANKVRLLERVVSYVRASATPTTLLVVSDHGHIAPGGSGGSSPEERDAPLLVFRSGSTLGSRALSTRCTGEGGSFSTIDVAQTVAALLRVPVPRHSQGSFIEDAFDGSSAEPSASTNATGRQLQSEATPWTLALWQWRDLYYQAHAVASGYLQVAPPAAHGRPVGGRWMRETAMRQMGWAAMR